MKKSRKKASETPASHNGIYRIDEMSKAFGIPENRIYFWTIQEKLVSPDYAGRSQRPSLFLEKSAAVILMIRELMKEGVRMADIKAFIKRNHIPLFQNSCPEDMSLTIHKGIITYVVHVGQVRKNAKKLLKEYIDGLQQKPRAEVRPVQAHNEQSVKATPGMASV